MNLFNLKSGLYYVQVRCISIKIWTQITPFFRPNYIFNKRCLFFSFSRTKFPLIFFNLNLNQQALHFGVLNYEKQHKEGTCKVSGRSVIFSAFYAAFCHCLKSLIITTLKCHDFLIFAYHLCTVVYPIIINVESRTHNVWIRFDKQDKNDPVKDNYCVSPAGKRTIGM